MKNLLAAVILLVTMASCVEQKKEPTEEPTTLSESKADSIIKKPFAWEGANIYFLLTDRFYNGNIDNDVNFDRNEPTGPLRGFMGGDLAGITQKIEEGYFNELGVNAIWFTPCDGTNSWFNG